MDSIKKPYKTILVLVGVLCFIFGIIIGFYFGVEATAKEVVKIAKMFTKIEINEEMVKDAIFRYKNNIGSYANFTVGISP